MKLSMLPTSKINILSKLTIALISLLSFIGCAKYPTPPITAPFDTSKAGNVYETNITIKKEDRYAFDLEYVADYNSSFEHKTIYKLLGERGYSSNEQRPSGMYIRGVEVVLKLTITPYQTLQKPVVYNDGNDPFFRPHTIPIDSPIVIISNMADIVDYTHKGKTSDGADNSSLG